ncbi:DNA polymerase Y family protein [Nostocoides sp. HKS02]|uniref:DNA polymerase Y family protein n=1 Tax=Nostocoides sp. HKS02 TaxID=1813880 RepID=UPI0012B4C9CC|nr:DNA polymerase Y family protein [Tetrasphaera sp. HKS02]QGN58366.1 DNA polymerase Y family protein [Tetrasphaera sp. HKS02]
MQTRATPSPKAHKTARSMILWCPDWPVRAIRHTSVGAAFPERTPLALLAAGAVYACSAAARKEGVRREMRLRDAQSRCPDLVTFDYDAGLDLRAFEPVLAAVEEISPGVQLIRPGTCALRVDGSSRYFRSEEAVAAVVAERLVELGVPDCRFGIADSTFTAEQAARRALPQDCVVVEPGGSAEFLSPLPVSVLDRPELVSVLRRLGLRTLGAFAALPHRDVLNRFGDDGARAHQLAGGTDDRPFVPRRPPQDHECAVSFEPALEQIDPIAFSMRQGVDEFVARLTSRHLVCTSIWIEVHTDRGDTTAQQWTHPHWFTAADVIDRLRWQLAADGVDAPVVQVRIIPETLAPQGDFDEGLWGGGSDLRIERAISKVQAALGRESVVTAVCGGGRTPVERQTMVPWGDLPTPTRSATQPWPGSLPPPAPATVFQQPRPACVVDAFDRPVDVTDRGALTAAPHRFAVGDPGATEPLELRPVDAWAGPWLIESRWWDPQSARRGAWFQLVDPAGHAWLLGLDGGVWWAEARYD